VARDAGFFDQWYSEMGRSGLRDQIARRALGLPPGMDASGLLPWTALTEVTTALNLAPGQLPPATSRVQPGPRSDDSQRCGRM
jgi:hypothetical protein